MVEKVKLWGITLTCKNPDNIIQLKDDKIFVINNILNIQEKYVTQEIIDNLYIYGIVESKSREVFDYPTSSIDICLTEVTSWKKHKILFNLTCVKCKYNWTLIIHSLQ